MQQYDMPMFKYHAFTQYFSMIWLDLAGKVTSFPPLVFARPLQSSHSADFATIEDTGPRFTH
jgi:hypothetical protein